MEQLNSLNATITSEISDLRKTIINQSNFISKQESTINTLSGEVTSLNARLLLQPAVSSGLTTAPGPVCSCRDALDNVTSRLDAQDAMMTNTTSLLTTSLDNVTSRLDAQDAMLTNVTSQVTALTAGLAGDRARVSDLSRELTNTTQELGRRLDQCLDDVTNASAALAGLQGLVDVAVEHHACQQMAPQSGLGKAECDFSSPNGPWIIIQVFHSITNHFLFTKSV